MRRLSAPATVLLLTLAPGCSSRAPQNVTKIFSMGEPAQAGQLIYTVTDAEWLDQLDEPPAIRIPQRRFLVLRISVTNSGAGVSGVPAMRLEDGRGEVYEELPDGRGVPGWLGAFRLVQPADTETGAALFDAPLGSYRLRLIDDASEENEVSVWVEIPIQVGPKIPDLVHQFDEP